MNEKTDAAMTHLRELMAKSQASRGADIDVMDVIGATTMALTAILESMTDAMKIQADAHVTLVKRVKALEDKLGQINIITR